MVETLKAKAASANEVMKIPTGIAGLDEITGGGLPKNRASLVCGGPGCGKTLLALEFLVNGATEFGEPGLFVSFEESEEELACNVASLGWDILTLKQEKNLAFMHVVLNKGDVTETGEYDLEGLFVRMALAVERIGAKRVVLDTVESLFGSLASEHILRIELRRMFQWFKSKELSVVITGERGDKTLTRQGLEEYVSDCVIEMRHEVCEGISTRRLRVIKYRGSRHGADEYPFLINAAGISILPVTSLGLDYDVCAERVSTGVKMLDAMLDGKGYFRGSSILATGTAGTGKSSLAAGFTHASCARGERCVYFSFEESPRQIVRNMRSIGIDLQPHVDAGLLVFHSVRPTSTGLEMHLLTMHDIIARYDPKAVVIDPISNFISVGSPAEVKSIIIRFIDLLKSKGITSVFTDLTTDAVNTESTNIGISSLMDTWILLRTFEQNGERNRGLFVLKSRGMPHSNQVREFVLSDNGIALLDAYLGADGVIMGSARVSREVRDQVEALRKQEELKSAQRDFERKKAAIEGQISTLRAEILEEEAQLRCLVERSLKEDEAARDNSIRIAVSRSAGPR